MITLPITEQQKQQEWGIIREIVRNNGFPTYIIQDLKKLISKKQKQNITNCINKKK
jgi:hypothetical protein